MKINPSQIAKAMEIYKSQKSSSLRSERKDKQQKDQLVLSDTARAFQLALKAVQRDDGIDYEKVKELKERFETGQYNVSSRDIADKMVEDLLSKKRI